MWAAAGGSPGRWRRRSWAGRSLDAVPRWSRDLPTGALTGFAVGLVSVAVAVVSHLAAGGAATLSAVLGLASVASVGCTVIAGVAVVAKAVASSSRVERWARVAGWLAPLIVVVLAHPWLEASGGHGGGHGFAHGAHAEAPVGLLGALAHAATPAMLMFGSHLLGLAALLAALLLMGSVVDTWTRGLPRITGWLSRCADTAVVSALARKGALDVVSRSLARAPPCPA